MRRILMLVFVVAAFVAAGAIAVTNTAVGPTSGVTVDVTAYIKSLSGGNIKGN